MKIVITEFMDEAAIGSLRDRFTVIYDPALVEHPAELRKLVSDAPALIVRNRTQVNAEMLAAAKQLRIVGRLGVGLDNIDVPACRERGIKIIPATGANALAVAEYVISTALILLRGAYLSSAEVAAGKWPRVRLSEGREASGQTLGLIGFGGIGQLAAKLAQGFGMHVVAYDPLLAGDAPLWQQSGVTRRELDDLLAEADVVSLHVPLTEETHGLINAARLARMKPDAILINTARGGIIDEMALAAALGAGKLGGAALDVFEKEPLTEGSPLATAPNLILTPHIAGVTKESNVRVSTMIAAKVADFLLGA